MEQDLTAQAGNELHFIGRNLINTLFSRQKILEQHLSSLKGLTKIQNHKKGGNFTLKTNNNKLDISNVIKDQVFHQHECYHRRPKTLKQVSDIVCNLSSSICTSNTTDLDVIKPKILNEAYNKVEKGNKACDDAPFKRINVDSHKDRTLYNSEIDKPKIFQMDDRDFCYIPKAYPHNTSDINTTCLKFISERTSSIKRVRPPEVAKEVQISSRNKRHKSLKDTKQFVQNENPPLDKATVIPESKLPVSKALKINSSVEDYIRRDSVSSPSSFSSESDIVPCTTFMNTFQHEDHKELNVKTFSRDADKLNLKISNPKSCIEHENGEFRSLQEESNEEISKLRCDCLTRQPGINDRSITNKINNDFSGEMQTLLNVLNSRTAVHGYDWVAAMMDSADSSVLGHPPDYFENLKQFRNSNKHECLSFKTLRTLEENVEGATHDYDHANPCVHEYRINNRLFPEPCKTDDTGMSICSICKLTKEEAHWKPLCNLKIHVPLQKLESASQLCLKKRNINPDPNSLALSQNCQPPQELKIPCFLLH